MQKELIKHLLTARSCIDQLKMEVRHSWISNGRRESVAEHSWGLSLLVVMCAEFVDQPVNLEKCLIMAIVHDLPEAITGDTPYFLIESENKALEKSNKEDIAMQSICSKFPRHLGEKFYNSWLEYSTGTTYEARFVKALDRIKAQMQRNLSPINTWIGDELIDSQSRLNKFCDFDSFLKELKLEIQNESKLKIQREKGPTSIKGKKATV